MRSTLLCILFLTSLHSVLSGIPSWPPRWGEALSEDFNWSSVEPQSKLRYTPCYDGFECGRYLVPLDWTQLDLLKWKKVALAVARLPAKVPQSDPKFGGTIVLNPGGPSGSGIDLLQWAGRGIQQLVDGDKHFEILAFDPRGTKYSTPSVSCYESNEDRFAWLVANAHAGSVDDGTYSLNVRWALSQGFGMVCDHTKVGIFPDGSNMRQYVSTAQVAYDMVKLTDAIEEELKYSLASQAKTPLSQEVLTTSEREAVLNYWGFSYGTYLGNTYASMFPGRVGRMVLDGVVDAPDYTATGWTSNLQNNDKLWNIFFEWCFEAGALCALYDDRMGNGSDIHSKVTVFLDLLRENPIPFLHDDGKLFLWTYSSLQAILHLSSYGPYQSWPLLAVILQQLIQNDPDTLDSLKCHMAHISDPFIPALGHHSLLNPFVTHAVPYLPGYPHSLDASIAILCGDGDRITSDSKSDFISYISLLKNQSNLIGPLWADITLQCRHWPESQRPLERNRFTGPFTSNLSDYQQDSRSSPLLFIGNTADPVTPLRNAVAMASHHEGARVLIQDAPGHCSGVTIPSRCTWDAVRKFFNTGKLPENGTVCGVDWKPWDYL